MQVINLKVRDDLPLTEAEWAAWRHRSGLPPARSSSSSGEKRRKKKRRKRKLPKVSSPRSSRLFRQRVHAHARQLWWPLPSLCACFPCVGTTRVVVTRSPARTATTVAMVAGLRVPTSTRASVQAWPLPSTCCTCSASRRDRSLGVSNCMWARIALLLSVAGAEVDAVGFLGPGRGGHRNPRISKTGKRCYQPGIFRKL